MIGFNKIEIKGSSFVELNSNAGVETSGDFKISENSNLYLRGENDKKVVISKKLICDKGVLTSFGNSYIIINEELSLGGNCKVNFTARTIRDIPLFQVNKVSNFDKTILAFDNQFDIAFANTNQSITGITPNNDVKMLQNNRLVRFGDSTKLFCHLGVSSSGDVEYIESYCPCSGADCYITPLSSVTSFKIDIASDKLQTKKAYEMGEIFNEVVVLGSNNLFSFAKTDGVVMYSNNKNSVSIQMNEMTKEALFISNSSFLISQQFKQACKYCYTNNGNMTCNNCTNECPDYKYNATGKECSSCQDLNCESCTIGVDVCLKCGGGYYLINGKCGTIPRCQLIQSNRCRKCDNGYLLKEMKCVTVDNCVDKKVDGSCLICDDKDNTVNINGNCEHVDNTKIVHQTVISCESGFVLNKSLCNKCDSTYPNSVLCENGKTTKCDDKSKMSLSGTCEIDSCVSPNDENGKCKPEIDGCSKYANTRCVECQGNLILSQNTCIQIEVKNCTQMKLTKCVRCEDGYYIDETTNGECSSCNTNCKTCISNSTFCLSCNEKQFLSNHKCLTNKDLENVCTQFVPSGGCVKCINGYYRNGLSCEKCDVKCGTCNNKEMCLTCNETNYKTANNECKPQSDVIGCKVEVTQNGCLQCSDGYYTVNTNECGKCDESCLTCLLLNNKCTSCGDTQVLVDSKCLNVSEISNCNEVTKSKCSKCTFWHVPSDDGTYCNSKAVWWVILIIVLFILLVVIIVIILIMILFNYLLQRKHEKKLEKTTTLFSMNKSNIQFVRLPSGICISPDQIDLNLEVQELPIETETKVLFCVGNTKRMSLKVQFSLKSDVTKFTMKCSPDIVTLKKGFACEFSIGITPICTSKIDTTLLVISKSLKDGKENYNEVKMVGITAQSTRIDPDELKEEKKLGEGSFGIVVKGTFRNNTVAIKKMKEVSNEKVAMVEFTKEVEMLDKFRSEYIVHFYGAVFIPNKVCMVTEFAPFGSLQDLISKRKSNEVNMKLKIKFMLDASKGLLYLHENGILHRDIKPDNLLVFSLESNDTVNAKLTDFGSARNINMLMTNMTFTKGIGTPKYMAPEILEKEKYKKEADVYSLAITMYECFTWADVFPKTQFKYPWDIVNYISNGKRLTKPDNVDTQLFVIITQAWQQSTTARSDIQSVSKELRSVYMKC
ncbi:protein serine/threonine kinase, putative [Entamoeba invadens IP1]|uniref:Protein serine/threonine kinase, putative n=1 Tax=Entamoeba invadens IP1 TaxID=370355 RepID=A0A0A1UD58_ENTIV|nr:protein serine/threonine kinase, putative [Entamoeba invadens IP1]ELP94289.1 protein serine/threonine kinase, putative [Entamoeba invadens IP1]|eukprot:XP_004261060.1 protein serine/threonine kinase, putative [Entamoeba invadens IP1]